MATSKKKKPKKKAPIGRPTSYKPEYAKVAAMMCLNGAIDPELAEEFGVSIPTLYNWRAKYPEFLKAIVVNKEIADSRVERSLYQRAVGYTQESEKVFMQAGSREPVRVPFKENVPPDVSSMIFWLKNRQPLRWKDRHEQSATVTHITRTPDELRQLIMEKIAEMGFLPAEAVAMLPAPFRPSGIANIDEE